MKKIRKFLCAGIAGLLFLSCNQANNPTPVILNLPIDRNIELNVLKEIKITKDWVPSNDEVMEAFGKDIFLVIQNSTSIVQDVKVSPTESELDTVTKMYKENIYKNGKYLNVPAQLTEVNIDFSKIPVDISSDFTINRSQSETESETTTWDANLSVGDTHDFSAATEENKTNQDYAKNAKLKKIGQHCYIWYVTKDGIDVDTDKLNKLADIFDSIYEKETYIFGTNRPSIPRNVQNYYISCPETESFPKVHVIVYDLYGDYETTKENGAGTFGYFWGLDFLKNSTLENYPWGDAEEKALMKKLQSNECQCLHLDSYFLSEVPEMVYSTITHEFQHLLHFVNKSLKYKISNTWFNEMLSMVCEDIMLTQLGLRPEDGPQARLNLFNQTYDWGFQDWYKEDNVYISYANAYAFGAYLLRNFGIDFIKELAHNNYVDEEAIIEACKTCNISGISNFSDIMHRFYTAILNPKNTENSFNKSVSKTYSINGTSVTFNCDAINLFDYLTIPKNEMTIILAAQLYQGVFFQNYYGPVIYNRSIPKDIGRKGTFITKIDGFMAGVKLIDENWNEDLDYYLVITEKK